MESFIDPSYPDSSFGGPGFGGPGFGGPVRPPVRIPPLRGLPPPGYYEEKGLPEPENKNIPPPHEESRNVVLGGVGLASMALGDTKTIIVASLLVILSMYLFFAGHPSLATIPLGIIIGVFTFFVVLSLFIMITFRNDERERVNRSRQM